MESQSESYFVVHNESKNRFEIALSGWTAFAEYRVEGDRKSRANAERGLASLRPAASPSPAGESPEKGPGVEAVVPTACLSTGPWHKGLYN